MYLNGRKILTTNHARKISKLGKILDNTFSGEITAEDLIGCTFLKDDAFRNCRLITSITLPETITSIGANAFNTCEELATLIILRTSSVVELVNKNAFNNTWLSSQEDGKIYVPSDLVSTYKNTSKWSDFASKIYPISQLEN